VVQGQGANLSHDPKLLFRFTFFSFQNRSFETRSAARRMDENHRMILEVTAYRPKYGCGEEGSGFTAGPLAVW
jgi:hypothetical protein